MPALDIHIYEIEARYPDRGLDYVHALEEVERTVPLDEKGKKRLSYLIADGWLRNGRGRPYLEQIEPRFLANDPDLLQWQGKEDTGMRATILYNLGWACVQPDVRDYARAIDYWEQSLPICPPGVLESTYGNLANYARRIGDYPRAARYLEMLLAEFPESRNVEVNRQQLSWVYQQLAADGQQPQPQKREETP